jgi:hypothetical protein
VTGVAADTGVTGIDDVVVGNFSNAGNSSIVVFRCCICVLVRSIVDPNENNEQSDQRTANSEATRQRKQMKHEKYKCQAKTIEYMYIYIYIYIYL